MKPIARLVASGRLLAAGGALAAFLALGAPGADAAGGKEEPAGVPAVEEATYDIAVFVPGVAAGSPLYEQLVSGAERAVREHPGASLRVLEAGFNQGEWKEKLTSLAATGEHELILTSNPAMPALCAEVAADFPRQKFLVVDGWLQGNPQLHTLLYNQVEQGYFAGYLGGLVTKSGLAGANPRLAAGLLVAQQYPALDRMIRPGFEAGLRAADPGIELDFRVIGNWYDANKAAELAGSMFDAGVDVVLTIAGGANQGTIRAARERGRYVLYFDSNEFRLAPGTIVGCAVLRQERAVYERASAAIEGRLAWGEAEVVGARDGYVDFVEDDPLYIQAVPEEIRRRVHEKVEQVRRGELVLEAPRL